MKKFAQTDMDTLIQSVERHRKRCLLLKEVNRLTAEIFFCKWRNQDPQDLLKELESAKHQLRLL